MILVGYFNRDDGRVDDVLVDCDDAADVLIAQTLLDESGCFRVVPLADLATQRTA